MNASRTSSFWHYAFLTLFATVIFFAGVLMTPQETHAYAEYCALNPNSACPYPYQGQCRQDCNDPNVCFNTDICIPPSCASLGQEGGYYPNCTTPNTCPSAGQSCSSAPNSCGLTSSGTIDASSCTCTATPPSDSMCTCGNGSSGPYPSCPPPPPACVWYAGSTCSATNSCSMTNYGTYDCDGNCPVSPPSDGLCTPPPTASLSASPTSIVQGNSSTLSYSCTNSTSASINQGIGAVSGTSRSVSPGSTTTYTLTCTGAGGSRTASATVTVTAPAQADYTATTGAALSGTAGGSATAAGTVRNIGGTASGSAVQNNFQICSGVNGCTGYNQWYSVSTAGSVAAGGSAAVSRSVPLPATAGSYTYRLCANVNAAWTANPLAESDVNNNCGAWVNFTVSAPVVAPTASLSASPTSIVSGNSSTLSYSCTNSTSATINQGIGAVSGTSRSVSPGSTTTYTLTCTGPGGSATANATITVSAAPTPADYTAATGSAVSGAPGASITMGGTVNNIGGTSSGVAVQNMVQMCANTACSGGYNVYQPVSTPGAVAAGGSAAVSRSMTLSATPGTYMYRLCANINSGWTGNPLTESNYNNNCGSWSNVTVNAPAISASCSVSPASATTGQSVTWSATASGGTGSFTYAWTGTDSLTGSTASVAKTYATTGTKTGSVTVTSGSQTTGPLTCSNSVAVSAAPAPDLTATLTGPASPQTTGTLTLQGRITNGGSALATPSFTQYFEVQGNGTLTWTSPGITIAAGASSNVSASRSFSAGSYQVRVCADGAGNVAESNEGNNCSAWSALTVNAPASPTATLTPPSATIIQGGSTTLTWSSSNATSCTGGGFSTGGATSGSVSVSPGATASYTLTCTGPGGTDTDSSTITVNPPACTGAGPLTLTASPSRVQSGGSTTLTWTGANVASGSCTLVNQATGTTVKTSTVSSCNVSDSAVVSNITAQSTFVLTCGALTKEVIVNVVPKIVEF